MTKQEYLESLNKNDCLAIIKYGLKESNAPVDVNVEDIFETIGCLYMAEKFNNMWIARDKDGSLYLYEDKPIRGIRMFGRDKTITYRHSDVAIVYGGFGPLSEVTWENSPKELIIKK